MRALTERKVATEVATAPPRASMSAIPPDLGPGVRDSVAQQSSMLAFVRGLYLLYVFLMFSRAHEFLFPIPKLAAVLAMGTTFLSLTSTAGLPLLRSKFTRMFALFGLIMCVSAIFGYWQGGSAKTVYRWLPYLVIFIAGVPMITGLEHLRKLMSTIALATTFVAVGSLLFGGQMVDRLTLGHEGTISDPNDLATIVLFGVPCWVLVFLLYRRVLAKLVATFAMSLAITVLVRTGSRSGMVTAAAILIGMVVLRPRGKRLAPAIASVMAALGIAAAALCLAPDAVLTRLRTIIAPTQSVARSSAGLVNEGNAIDAEEARARGSSAQRLELLRQGIVITLKHPLLGVGPGQFASASNEEFVLEGDRARWKSSHNGFTQVSAETGIPGLLIYIAILIMSFRRGRILTGAEEPRLSDLNNAGYAVRLAVVAYMVGSFFLNVAYMFYLPALAVMANALAAEAEHRSPSFLTPSASDGPFVRSHQSSMASELRAALSSNAGRR